MTQSYCLFDTAIGSCGLAWSAQGITRLQLPEADRTATERRLSTAASPARVEHPPPSIRQIIANLQRYLRGDRVDFASVAVDFSGVSPSHREIYDVTRSIGWGSTATYGEIARRAGSAGAARIVGQAMARNRVPIIIPCHRVLASGNRIGGFSAYGGVVTKERLLSLEGVGAGDGTPRLPGL